MASSATAVRARSAPWHLSCMRRRNMHRNRRAAVQLCINYYSTRFMRRCADEHRPPPPHPRNPPPAPDHTRAPTHTHASALRTNAPAGDHCDKPSALARSATACSAALGLCPPPVMHSTLCCVVCAPCHAGGSPSPSHVAASPDTWVARLPSRHVALRSGVRCCCVVSAACQAGDASPLGAQEGSERQRVGRDGTTRRIHGMRRTRGMPCTRGMQHARGIRRSCADVVRPSQAESATEQCTVGSGLCRCTQCTGLGRSSSKPRAFGRID